MYIEQLLWLATWPAIIIASLYLIKFAIAKYEKTAPGQVPEEEHA